MTKNKWQYLNEKEMHNAYRSSHQRYFKKAVLKYFGIFTGKHLCWSLILIKLRACKFKACTFIKKRLQHSCSPVNISKFLKTPILKNICKWLLLCLTMKHNDSMTIKDVWQ